jgi:hypothetical protein
MLDGLSPPIAETWHFLHALAIAMVFPGAAVICGIFSVWLIVRLTLRVTGPTMDSRPHLMRGP